MNTINPFQVVSIFSALNIPWKKGKYYHSLSLEATLLKYLFILGTGRLTKRMKINVQMGGCSNPLMWTCCCGSDKVTRSLAGKWHAFVGISGFPVNSTTCILWSSFMVTLTLTGSSIFQKWWQYEWCWDCWKALILWRRQALLWVDLTSLYTIAVQCCCLSFDPSWKVGTGFCSQCTFLWEQLIAPQASQKVTFPQPIFNHNSARCQSPSDSYTVYCLLASHHALYNDVVLQWKMLVLLISAFLFRPTSDLGKIHLLFLFFNLKTFSGIRGLAYFSDDVPV